jgi:hypothetical protein
MAKATTTTLLSTASGAQLICAQRVERKGLSVFNASTSSNVLTIIVGSTTVGSSTHTCQIAAGGLYEAPRWYAGEAVTGVWASSSSGYGCVTEWL